MELYGIPHLCDKMPSHDSRGNNLEVLEGINTGWWGTLKLHNSTAVTGSETVIESGCPNSSFSQFKNVKSLKPASTFV